MVAFRERSTFRRAEQGGRWYYEDGEVDYEGESLEDRFDTDERRAAIAEQKAKMEEKRQAAASA